MSCLASSLRIGATSFVLPAGVTENIHFLADKVDDVQLLYFESSDKSLLSHGLDVKLLKNLAVEFDLSYTVHLPLDLSLSSPDAAERVDSVAEVCRIVEEVAILSPLSFDLHLEYGGRDRNKDEWLAAVDASLDLLAGELGDWTRRIAVENLNYPFREVRSLALDHGMSLCLDFGHALYYGDHLDGLIEDIPRASHIHYHGVDEKDHQTLTIGQRDVTTRIGEALRASDYEGVFTLEIYEHTSLYNSLLELSEAWNIQLVTGNW